MPLESLPKKPAAFVVVGQSRFLHKTGILKSEIALRCCSLPLLPKLAMTRFAIDPELGFRVLHEDGAAILQKLPRIFKVGK